MMHPLYRTDQRSTGTRPVNLHFSLVFTNLLFYSAEGENIINEQINKEMQEKETRNAMDRTQRKRQRHHYTSLSL